MDSKLMLGLAAAITVALAGSAIAVRTLTADDDGHAKVLSATPVTETRTVAREQCQEVPVTHQYQEQGRNITGTAIGAVVGGVLGNQVGSGSGRKAATAAGAIAGGVVGNRVQARQRPLRSATTLETRCNTVNDTVREPAGFEVVYEYQGETQTIRMPYDPGPRLKMSTTTAPVIEEPLSKN